MRENRVMRMFRLQNSSQWTKTLKLSPGPLGSAFGRIFTPVKSKGHSGNVVVLWDPYSLGGNSMMVIIAHISLASQHFTRYVARC